MHQASTWEDCQGFDECHIHMFVQHNLEAVVGPHATLLHLPFLDGEYFNYHGFLW